MFDRRKALADFDAMTATFEAVEDARKKRDLLLEPLVKEITSRSHESLKQVRISSELASKISDAHKSYLSAANLAGMDFGNDHENPLVDGKRFIGTFFGLPIYEVSNQREAFVVDA